VCSLSKRASVWEVQWWKSEHEDEDCARHLKAPSKPVFGGQQAPQTAAASPQIDCSPIRLNVSNAIRVDSVEPLTDGEPVQDEAEGISLVLYLTEGMS
jgi:hypothetical protein